MFQNLFACALTITAVQAHSQMTVPAVRTLRSELRHKGMNPLALIRPDGFHPKPGQQLKVGSDNFLVTEDDFACRGGARGKPTATLTAGSNYNIKIKVYAPHPGDFALYASYDTDDTIKDVDKKWHLIYKRTEALCCKCNDPASMCECGYSWKNAKGKDVCSYNPGPTSRLANHPGWDLTCSRGCEQDRTLTVPIPSWMPAGQSVILRYESYALHLRDKVDGHPSGGNQVEIYATCADVTVLPSADSVPVSALTSVTIKRAQHLPNRNTKFPAQYTRIINEGPTPGDMFPPVACIGSCLLQKTTTRPMATPSMQPTPTTMPITKPTRPTSTESVHDVERTTTGGNSNDDKTDSLDRASGAKSKAVVLVSGVLTMLIL